ncbi:hypothetical protein BKA57DRAFT_454408 [Linnemannia elongata]|nr:hypothetical protein BKA57DRAFT_454408 [Linnemannia elongata]
MNQLLFFCFVVCRSFIPGRWTTLDCCRCSWSERYIHSVSGGTHSSYSGCSVTHAHRTCWLPIFFNRCLVV